MATRTRLRVFISSPGDVRRARLAAAQTVEKLAPEYLRFFDIEPYLWETETLVSSGTFQDSIEPPSDFDIVVLILWSRLGTLLPERTAVRSYRGIDGRAPVTGTEWEYEDALRAARASKSGAPALLVYRSREQASIDTWDPEKRKDQLAQIAAMEVFWSRHFADRGAFIGAYYEFATPDDLAVMFEGHLRQLVERKVVELATTADASPARVWPKAPFVGLQSYAYDQAPIFFGREAAVGDVLSQLIANSEAGRAFVLVLGASGSGKSSLALAGVAPRLKLPRRVTGVTFLRRVIFRPSDMQDQEDVFGALARVLTADRGNGEGVPEFGAPDRLARVLRETPDHCNLYLESTLDALTEQVRGSGSLNEQVSIVLVVDQLEELFTDRRIPATDRERFVAAIDALARGQRVWVVATMRSDLWHRSSETPKLVALSSGLGRYDLLAPKSAEVSQMIRLPAEAAALTFGRDSVTGVPLNDQIAEDASSAPGVLPLLSYVLEQLYQTDVIEAGRSQLSFATYKTLGGLKGAIAARAEAILSDQPETVRAALRPLIFSLVQVNRGESGAETITARRTPITEFAPEGPERKLLEAFLDPGARLLTAESGAGDVPVVRVAHEALLSEWDRARICMADDAIFLRIRHSTEERFERWGAVGHDRSRRRSLFSPEAGLLTGVDLEDAQRLLREYGTGLGPGMVAYVERSASKDRQRQRAALTAMSAVAAVMTALAVMSGAMTVIAHRNAALAETQSMDRALLHNEHDGEAALRAQDPATAIGNFRENVGIAETLIKRDPGDPHWLFNLANAHAHLGQALAAPGPSSNPTQAHSEYLATQRAVAELARVEGSDRDLHDKRVAIERWLEKRLQS